MYINDKSFFIAGCSAEGVIFNLFHDGSGGVKFGMKGGLVTRLGLILSQDGAVPSRRLFISSLGTFDPIFDPFWAKNGPK